MYSKNSEKRKFFEGVIIGIIFIIIVYCMELIQKNSKDHYLVDLSGIFEFAYIAIMSILVATGFICEILGVLRNKSYLIKFRGYLWAFLAISFLLIITGNLELRSLIPIPSFSG